MQVIPPILAWSVKQGYSKRGYFFVIQYYVGCQETATPRFAIRPRRSQKLHLFIKPGYLPVNAHITTLGFKESVITIMHEKCLVNEKCFDIFMGRECNETYKV